MDDDVFDILKVSKDLYEIVEQIDENIVDTNLPCELAEIVKFHAKGAAAAGVASGWVPGVGGTAMAITSAGFIWSMYARINEKIGLKFSENILKSVATGVATNLASYAIASIAITTVLSFIPFIGSGGAAVIAGSVAYAMTLVSGVIYMKTLETLFKSKKNLNNISENDLKEATETTMKNENLDEMIKQARKGYEK